MKPVTLMPDAETTARTAPNKPTVNVVESVLGRIETIVREGISHGYAQFTINIETVNRQRREVTVSAGKSYKYTIPEDQI